MFEVKMKDDKGWSGAFKGSLRAAAQWFEFDLANLNWWDMDGGLEASEKIEDEDGNTIVFRYQLLGDVSHKEWIEALHSYHRGDDDDED